MLWDSRFRYQVLLKLQKMLDIANLVPATIYNDYTDQTLSSPRPR